jgi:dCMP deaminase
LEVYLKTLWKCARTRSKKNNMADISPEEQKKQEYYRDARTGGYYGEIWQNVGKCVFCDLREKYIVMEENGMVMTVALYAYIDGNLMVLPRRHIRSIKELTDSEWNTARKMMYIAKKLIRKVHDIKGVQYIVRDGGITAQSTVSDHLHIHCIPFDAPDLSTWNYRKLKYTPLENASLFRERASYIARFAGKFEEKYAEPSSDRGDKKEVYRQAFSQLLTSKKTSKAKKTAKVGASIIVGSRIISMPNSNLADGPIEQEKDGVWVSPPTVSHAEERCIAQAAKDGLSLSGATMIVSLSPCMTCSRLIVSSGIKELHYIDDWWDQNALSFLAEHNVKVVKLPYKQK